MIYSTNLSANQQLYLENKDNQTILTIISVSSGQQQSQSSSFQTGKWTTPPTVFNYQNNYCLRIDTTQGQHFIQLQADGFTTLATPPSLVDADVIPLQRVASAPTSQPTEMKFKPLEPMSPMQMGNMSMNMKPMEMKMGDMYMRMPDNSEKQSSSKNFCTQCGSLVKASDRFCGNCGHKLED